MADRYEENPFTPTFGGLPERFFGRADLVSRVERALEHPQSPDAALFITGPRGCGKTALLEHLSGVAKHAGWLVIDVHSLGAASSIARQLDGADLPVEAKTLPQVTLPGGVGVSLGTTISSNTSAQGDLVEALVRRASSLTTRKGIFITVDEIQKISESDMEQICAAVQMARRKALPVALMLAGLPGAKELVASYRGCTFMQRVEDVHLGGLLIEETIEAFKGLLALVRDIEVDHDTLWDLASMSQGYPYLVQLVGYHFVESLRKLYPVGVIEARWQDASAIEEAVYAEYRANVLVPSAKGLKAEGLAYLRAMANLLDEDGFADTGEVARSLGKNVRQLSSCRQNLINRRLVIAGARGRVCYGLPYLTRFSLESPPTGTESLQGKFVPR